ncbi:MAG: 16S rRNA (guanine(966)-N(2))-methyltransferase RsmD [Alphaproteobacteria bacterium]
MRIVGGAARGLRLATPGDKHIRPTSDRVREALFNILAHGIEDFSMSGIRVLDLYAGTGALGIEALSRGAAFCVFQDTDPRARALVRTNIENAGLAGKARISRRDATNMGPIGRGDLFNLVLLDPPYDRSLATVTVASLVAGGWLAPGALVVVEEARGAPFAWDPALREESQRAYGDTLIRIAGFDPG